MSTVKRLAVPLFVAVILSAMPLAGVGAWSTNCGSSNKVCIYANDGFGLPVAAQNGSNGNYNTGEKYYNSDIYINDSANGGKNFYSANDVIFHNDGGNTGGAFCIDSNLGYSTIGFFNNDRWSSHALIADDNAC